MATNLWPTLSERWKVPWGQEKVHPPNCHRAPARQIRGVILSNHAAGPQQFQGEKNFDDSEFGQLFLSARLAYD
jgi:hypothetical protein